MNVFEKDNLKRVEREISNSDSSEMDSKNSATSSKLNTVIDVIDLVIEEID